MALLLVILGIRTQPKDLVPKAMFYPFDDAPNATGTQSDIRQGSNFFRAHSLPEVEPENYPVALLVGLSQAMLQVFIDLLQKDSRMDSLLTAVTLFACLGADIAYGNVEFVTAGFLTPIMLKMVTSDVGGSFLDISQNCVRMLDGEVA